MEQYQENNYQNYPDEGGQPHRPVIIVGEQNPLPARKNTNLAVTSLVLGILSLVFFRIFYLSVILGIIGLILGIVSIAQHRDGQGMAVAGIITSGLGVLISIVIIFLLVMSAAALY